MSQRKISGMEASTPPIDCTSGDDPALWAAFDADAAEYQRDQQAQRAHNYAQARTTSVMEERIESKEIIGRVLGEAFFSGSGELTDNEIAALIMWCAGVKVEHMARVLLRTDGTEGVSAQRAGQIFFNAWHKISKRVGININMSISRRVHQEHKRCTRCLQIKPVSAFYSSGGGRYMSRCKQCELGCQREAYARRKAAGD